METYTENNTSYDVNDILTSFCSSQRTQKDKNHFSRYVKSGK